MSGSESEAAFGSQPGAREGRTQWALLLRLGAFIRPYRRWLVLAVLATAAGGLLGLGFPWVLGSLVDSALDPESGPADLGWATAVLLAIFAAQALVAALRIYCLAYAGQHIVNNLRSALFNNLIRLPTSFLDSRPSGALTARLISDASFAYGAASGAGPQMINSVITVIGGAALMLWIQPLLALLVLALLPVAGLVARRYGRRMRELSNGYQNGLATTNALAGDALSAARVVKLYAAEASVAAQYHRRLGAVIERGLERARARAFWTPATMFLTALGVVAVVWFGGLQVQSGALSAGALVSFLLYARFVATGTSTLVTQYSRLAQATGATERVISLLEEPREPAGLTKRPADEEVAGSRRANEAAEAATPDVLGQVHPVAPVGDAKPSAPTRGLVIAERTGEVTFEHVSFSYPTRPAAVLTDVNLTVSAGETLALVGQSGAGKTTLAQLIGRLYDVDSGTVLVDRVDVRQQNLTDLRRSIGFVPQDVMLLSGTVAENVRLGRRDASREEVANAARAANAHDFITGFPHGYGTRVGERGMALSGGQRQRIAIARAILSDPKLLILDEATNALDPQTEALVAEAIGRLTAGRTNIVIAHRLSTIMGADRVVVLHHGRIVEEGTPQELLAAGGHFGMLVSTEDLIIDGQPG